MANEHVKDRLGRGLAALLGDDYAEDESVERAKGLRTVPIEFIVPNSLNPRKNFNPEDIEELANSIREKGLLQPIVVRRAPDSDKNFEIIAGERRWRAAQHAQLHEVPVVRRDVSDAEALEIAIIENVQRTDLNAMEEAFGYRRLIDEFGYTQDQLSRAIGKSRPHLTNTLRLLKLPEKIKDFVTDGLLTAGHARALLASPDAETHALQVVQNGLSVRQTEFLVKENSKPKAAKPAKKQKDTDTLALESDLTTALGLKVDIRHKGAKGGELRISYKTLEQLDEICRRLTTKSDSDTF
jgi:ParB family chromosome partitioning protein